MAWRVELPAEPVLLPSDCACCGAAALHAEAIVFGARSLLVRYCDPCASHVARESTRRLATRIALLLLALSFASALPIFLPWLSLFGAVSSVVLAVGVPLLLGRLPRRVELGHAGSGPSVLFAGPTALICRRRDYAEAVARGVAAAPVGVSLPRRAPFFELSVGLAAAFVVTPFAFAFQHPVLRAINLSDVPLELLVDGRRLGRVEPSSGESPFAGLSVRVPAGRRTLLGLTADGEPRYRAEVELAAGARHLFALGSEDTCFWIETVGYGREGRPTDYEPLAGSTRFWVIPDDVHGWFRPAPQTSEGERSTGGSARVLRQGPCATAPH